jgi:hypothetical protein
MTLSLAEWDERIGKHLHGIEAGADMCLRHAHQMAFRPDFETLALGDLERAEKTLEAALRKIRSAAMLYRETPPDA